MSGPSFSPSWASSCFRTACLVNSHHLGQKYRESCLGGEDQYPTSSPRSPFSSSRPTPPQRPLEYMSAPTRRVWTTPTTPKRHPPQQFSSIQRRGGGIKKRPKNPSISPGRDKRRGEGARTILGEVGIFCQEGVGLLDALLDCWWERHGAVAWCWSVIKRVVCSLWFSTR